MKQVYENLIRMYTERMKDALNKPSKLIERTEGKDVSEVVETCELIAQGFEDGSIYNLYDDFRRGMLRRRTYEVQVIEEYRTLGEAIRDFRKQSKLSIQSLAEIGNVSSATIVNLENQKTRGKKGLRKDAKERLLSIFIISPSKKRGEIYNLPTKKEDEK